MITFKTDAHITVITEFDEATDNIVNETVETFKAGELVDAEIISEDCGYADLEFGDGSVALGIKRDWFDVVKVKSHLFSCETNCCVHCGINAEDDLVENTNCVVDKAN